MTAPATRASVTWVPRRASADRAWARVRLHRLARQEPSQAPGGGGLLTPMNRMRAIHTNMNTMHHKPHPATPPAAGLTWRHTASAASAELRITCEHSCAVGSARRDRAVPRSPSDEPRDHLRAGGHTSVGRSRLRTNGGGRHTLSVITRSFPPPLDAMPPGMPSLNLHYLLRALSSPVRCHGYSHGSETRKKDLRNRFFPTKTFLFAVWLVFFRRKPSFSHKCIVTIMVSISNEFRGRDGRLLKFTRSLR